MPSLNELVSDIATCSTRIDVLLSAKEEAALIEEGTAVLRFVPQGDGMISGRRDTSAANFCLAESDELGATARRITPAFGELLLMALHALRPQLITKALELADAGVASARATIDQRAQAISAEVKGV